MAKQVVDRRKVLLETKELDGYRLVNRRDIKRPKAIFFMAKVSSQEDVEIVPINVTSIPQDGDGQIKYRIPERECCTDTDDFFGRKIEPFEIIHLFVTPKTRAS